MATSDVDVPIAESQINLNWGPIMKTINEDPAEFFAGGGWGFLPIPGAPSDEVSLCMRRKTLSDVLQRMDLRDQKRNLHTARRRKKTPARRVVVNSTMMMPVMTMTICLRTNLVKTGKN